LTNGDKPSIMGIVRTEKIEDKLRTLGYKIDGLTMTEIIKFSQMIQGFRPCFKSARRIVCTEERCEFRSHCAGEQPATHIVEVAL